MLDDKGERVEEATPGTPVEVLGFDGVSEAGEHVPGWWRTSARPVSSRRRRETA